MIFAGTKPTRMGRTTYTYDTNWVWFLLLLRNDWHNAQNASPLPPVAPNPKVMERSIPWWVTWCVTWQVRHRN